jgi:DNA repair protein RadC
MKKYNSNMSEFKLKVEKTYFKKVKITQSSDAYNVIKQFYNDDIEIYESFFLLLLNRANNTTGYVKISQGGTIGTVVDVKLIAKYAVDSLSCAVILAHNHPSGNKQPSQNDRNMTKKVKEALKLFEIQVLDHIILTSESYFSFGDEGII